MQHLLSVAEVRAAEQRAVDAGTSESELMIAAGTAVAELLTERTTGVPGRVLFLVGPGNNGGDGLVAAAQLAAQGSEALVWGFRRSDLAGAPVAADDAARLHWLEDLDAVERACGEVDVIVDAVFGIGGRADVPAEVASVFAAAHSARIRQGVPLWSIDVPSGVDADSGQAAEAAFRADVTVMLGLPKIGLYRGPAVDHAGRLILVDIGLEGTPNSEAPALIDAAFARAALPRRPAVTHKKAVGSLLVVGGAPTYYGAPRLAAAAAARAGAGLVTLAVARSIVGSIASALPEVTFLPLPDGEFGGAGERMAEIVAEAAPNYSALLIGPGIGRDEPVGEFLAGLFGLRNASRPIGFGGPAGRTDRPTFASRAVIDADALNWLGQQNGWSERLRQAELVLTPHPGELGRLTGQSVSDITSDPWTAARQAARRFSQVVVLKHAHPVVALPSGELALGPQANPALATAGSGDVLAGIIAGLMCQGLSAADAACCGVLVGSEAAQLAVESVGTLGLIASDVIEALPWTLQQLYDPT